MRALGGLAPGQVDKSFISILIYSTEHGRLTVNIYRIDDCVSISI